MVKYTNSWLCYSSAMASAQLTARAASEASTPLARPPCTVTTVTVHADADGTSTQTRRGGLELLEDTLDHNYAQTSHGSPSGLRCQPLTDDGDTQGAANAHADACTSDSSSDSSSSQDSSSSSSDSEDDAASNAGDTLDVSRDAIPPSQMPPSRCHKPRCGRHHGDFQHRDRAVTSKLDMTRIPYAKHVDPHVTSLCA